MSCLTCLALNLRIFFYTKRKNPHLSPDSNKEVPGQIKAKLFDMEKVYECVLILSLIMAIAPSIYVR